MPVRATLLMLATIGCNAPGTMWIAIRAEVADKDTAALVRNRTLLLHEWHKRLSRGPVSE